jgi:HK97 family phage prohead protease
MAGFESLHEIVRTRIKAAVAPVSKPHRRAGQQRRSVNPVDLPTFPPGKLVGRVAVFDVPGTGADGIETVLRPGCFAEALRSTENTVACVMHAEDEGFLGSVYNQTLRLWQDNEGLMCEIVLPNNRLGRLVALCVHRGRIRGMSFYSQGMRCTFNEDRTKRVVHEVERLVDVSVAQPAAFPQTSLKWAPTFGTGR